MEIVVSVMMDFFKLLRLLVRRVIQDVNLAQVTSFAVLALIII
jgi:hypothetical protein